VDFSSFLGFYWEGGGLEVKGEVEGLRELGIEDAIEIDAAVFTVADDLFALRHEFHVEFDEVLVLGQFELVHFNFFFLQHHY
jgi:hypothetical protein